MQGTNKYSLFSSFQTPCKSFVVFLSVFNIFKFKTYHFHKKYGMAFPCKHKSMNNFTLPKKTHDTVLFHPICLYLIYILEKIARRIKQLKFNKIYDDFSLLFFCFYKKVSLQTGCVCLFLVERIWKLWNKMCRYKNNNKNNCAIVW